MIEVIVLIFKLFEKFKQKKRTQIFFYVCMNSKMYNIYVYVCIYKEETEKN